LHRSKSEYRPIACPAQDRELHADAPRSLIDSPLLAACRDKPTLGNG
jgi:hypothetical protein